MSMTETRSEASMTDQEIPDANTTNKYGTVQDIYGRGKGESDQGLPEDDYSSKYETFHDIYGTIEPIGDESIYEILGNDHSQERPKEFLLDYKDFFERLVEILTLALKIAPQRITSLTKLAADMMLRTNEVVFADLHETFVASLSKFVKTEIRLVEKKLTDGLQILNREDVQQLQDYLMQLCVPLQNQLEAFDKFKAVKELDQEIKRKIEEKYYTECAKSLQCDAKTAVEWFEKLSLKLSRRETTIEVFLVMTADFAENVICSLISREIQFSEGSGEGPLIDIKAQKPVSLEGRDFLRGAVVSLKEVIFEFCKATGLNHIQAASILGINILMSRSFEELRASLRQLECFMSSKFCGTEIEAFRNKYVSTGQISEISLYARKLYIQLVCLESFEIKPCKNSKIEYYDPLSLIEKSQRNFLNGKYHCPSSGENHSRHWDRTERIRLVSLLLIKTLVEKSWYLARKGKALDSLVKDMLKFEIQQTKMAKSRSSESSRIEDSEDRLFENEIEPTTETKAGQSEHNEEIQSEIGDAEHVEFDEETETKRSDI